MSPRAKKNAKTAAATVAVACAFASCTAVTRTLVRCEPEASALVLCVAKTREGASAATLAPSVGVSDAGPDPR